MTTDLIKEAAIEYLKEGLSVIPTAKNKKATKEWKERQEKRLTEEEIEEAFFWAEAIGILAGEISGGLEVIDVDCKYDLTGLLWDQLKTALEGSLPESLDKYVICSTQSGGYHILYRCDKIQKSSKLALRQATREEKEKEPKENFKGLIETRGEGAYILAYPSPGYNFVQGTIKDIPRITPEERDIIWSVCKSFNEVQEAEKPLKRSKNQTIKNSNTKSPFDDYNERADAVGLLEDHGWNVVKKQGERIFLKRPSTDSSSEYSGNYHTRHNKLVVFSLNTEFEPGEAYSPADIYILLNCNGDTKEAYKKLLAEGYGEPYIPEQTEIKKEKMQLENIVIQDQSEEVIVSQGETLDLEIIEGDESLYIVCQGYDALEEVKEAAELLKDKKREVYIKVAGEKEHHNYGSFLGLCMYYDLLKIGELDDKQVEELKRKIVKEKYGLNINELIGFKEKLLIPLSKLSEHFSEINIERQSEEYARAIEEAERKEQIKSLVNKTYSINDPEEALDKLREGIKKIDISYGSRLISNNTSFSEILNNIANLPPEYLSGYKSLDAFVGFKPGAITYIAGRPSHGKTTFMFNLMLNMIKEYDNQSFYFFSCEEPKENIIIKLLNNNIGETLNEHFYNSINSNYEFIKDYIKKGRKDIKKIETAKTYIGDLIDNKRLNIIDKTLYVEDIQSLIMYLKENENLGPVFIDYVQRIRAKKNTKDLRLEIAHISDTLLKTAKDTKIPLIIGSQFNRNTTGEGKLEHLKEAGNLEEDANLVLSVYCEAKEKEESGTATYLRKVDLKIKAIKNREGEVNKSVKLSWDRYLSKITNE